MTPPAWSIWYWIMAALMQFLVGGIWSMIKRGKWIGRDEAKKLIGG